MFQLATGRINSAGGGFVGDDVETDDSVIGLGLSNNDPPIPARPRNPRGRQCYIDVAFETPGVAEGARVPGLVQNLQGR